MKTLLPIAGACVLAVILIATRYSYTDRLCVDRWTGQTWVLHGATWVPTYTKPAPTPTRAPGPNTPLDDGETIALATYMRTHPEHESEWPDKQMVTLLQRFRASSPQSPGR